MSETSIFSACVISAATGICKKTVHRRAKRKGWPKYKHGNRVEYKVPVNLRQACRKFSSFPPIFNQPTTIRELKRAAFVLAFVLETQRNPKQGIERTLQRVANNFRRIMRFSPRALRNWVSAVERGGLAALQERKAGCVGRKSARLERILK